MSGIRCTKFHVSRSKGSKVITISMLNFWTAGGAIELVLEDQKLVQLLFISITTSVPNFIIFLLTVHRAAIDSHSRNNNNNNKYSCKQQHGAKPCKAQQADQVLLATNTASTASTSSTASTAVQQAFKHQEQCGAWRTKHQTLNVHVNWILYISKWPLL